MTNERNRYLLFEAWTAEQQHQAKDRFSGIGLSDYRYELGLDGSVLCRRRCTDDAERRQ